MCLDRSIFPYSHSFKWTISMLFSRHNFVQNFVPHSRLLVAHNDSRWTVWIINPYSYFTNELWVSPYILPNILKFSPTLDFRETIILLWLFFRRLSVLFPFNITDHVAHTYKTNFKLLFPVPQYSKLGNQCECYDVCFFLVTRLVRIRSRFFSVW
jgi:hypothetical protein